MDWKPIENLTDTFVGDKFSQEHLRMIHWLKGGVNLVEVVRVGNDNEFVLVYKGLDGGLTHFKHLDVSEPS